MIPVKMGLAAPRFVHVPTTMADKLQKSLDCLLMERFTVQDKTLLEKLLTSLHDSDALLKTIPVATHREWFSSVLDVYVGRQTPISKNSSAHVLYAFALKYLAVLVKSDDVLTALIGTRTVPSMIGCIGVESNLKEPAIFNAYLSLLRTLNNNVRGVEYVLQEGLWKHILFAINGLKVPAKYVEIQSSQYIADLIYKSIKYEIPHYYWRPLVEALFCKLNSTNSLIDQSDIKEFFAYNVYMKTLILLMEKCIGIQHESDGFKILQLALSDLLVNIHKLLGVAPVLLKNYVTLHLLFDCSTTWHHSDTECILKSTFSLMNVSKNVQSYRQVNHLYIQAIRYANISNTQLTNSAMFEKELINGQLTPLKKCLQWLKNTKNEQILFNSSCVGESKMILNYNNEYDSIINEMAISSILNIIDIVPLLKQETLDYLVEFFSILTELYLLSDYWLQPHQNQNSILCKFSDILSYIFICWCKVLEHKLICNVPHNSITVPLVQSHCEFFHKSSHTSTTLLQNGLKLISTALHKRIYINVLCDDNSRALDKLCTSLTVLLLDPRPEIRDSCLQCISSLVFASNYDSETRHIYIKIIMEKNLSIAVLNTLKHDKDPFVRAKALECLEKMVSVSSIWETSLKGSDLMDHCLRLMQYESEGIIRRQIVKLITALFIHNELNNELCNDIYIIMVHISIKDPLWEVKTFTYEFWNCVIKKFITKPCVLNDIETLNENLRKLSATGCIHVLYVALKEEYDLVVQKKAICLTKEFLASINSSNNVPYSDLELKDVVPSNCSNIMNDNLENCVGSVHKKSRHVDSEDRILNSITTISDCELLPSLKSANSSNIYPSDICLQQKTDDYTSVSEFLKFTSTYDFEECEAKTQWVISTRSGLNSMLDDIISQSQNCFIEGADVIDCH